MTTHSDDMPDYWGHMCAVPEFRADWEAGFNEAAEWVESVPPEHAMEVYTYVRDCTDGLFPARFSFLKGKLSIDPGMEGHLLGIYGYVAARRST